MNHLIAQARGRNLRMIRGVYLPTEKKGVVSDLYPRLGFRSASNSGEWWLEVSPGSGIEDTGCHIRTITDS